MRRALICLVSLVALLLVPSCGAEYSEGSVTNSGPVYAKLDEFQSPNGSVVLVFCRGGHKYYEYAYKSLQIIENHKECEGK